MKRFLTILAFLSLGFSAFAQEAQEAQEEDKAKEKEVKKGWSFGVLPTATWSTDNGFQAGLFGDVYYYGDGSTYPDPVHKISWEGSYFTHSHRMRLYLAYDSKYLIPKMRVNASVTYVTDPLYSFWGFNGPASVQNYDIWGNRNYADLYQGTNINYYGMGRDMLRVLANFQGQIIPHLNWAAGINFWYWKLGPMKDNGAKLKDENGNYIKDAEGNNQLFYYNKDFTLVRAYQNAGLLTEQDLTGGMSLEVNAGLVYDTRDMEAAPNKGIWAEAYLNGAPYAGNPANGSYNPYLKACVYFRQYLSIPIHIPAGEPVFAYRLAWQQTLLGETPFYMIQNVPLLVQRNMISEGFGSSNTLRGMRENRILAEGMAWVNTELRVKLVKFKLFNQFFYVAVNPFFDGGFITKQYKKDIIDQVALDGKIYDPWLALLGQDTLIYDASNAGRFIYSAGAGLKLAMNQNFIISAEYAKCFTPGMAADPWIGIGINYQF